MSSYRSYVSQQVALSVSVSVSAPLAYLYLLLLCAVYLKRFEKVFCFCHVCFCFVSNCCCRTLHEYLASRSMPSLAHPHTHTHTQPPAHPSSHSHSGYKFTFFLWSLSTFCLFLPTFFGRVNGLIRIRTRIPIRIRNQISMINNCRNFCQTRLGRN